MNAGTAASLGESKQPGMGYVPSPGKILNISTCYIGLVSLDEFPEGAQDRFRQVPVK
jgi:hypothetical protein